jgi:hypothetical protein
MLTEGRVEHGQVEPADARRRKRRALAAIGSHRASFEWRRRAPTRHTGKWRKEPRSLLRWRGNHVVGHAVCHTTRTFSPLKSGKSGFNRRQD